jgi:hypothetical protein
MRTFRTLLAFLALAIPVTLFGQVSFSISIGPPALPVYEQPICPGDGYLWTPGYWAYDESVSDYYWVDGQWVMAPEEGFLWTPGYWGWGDGGYRFNEGYWGPEVGFYGGINYGFGYSGEGYEGGRWDHGHFFYNREANHIDESRNRNVYDAQISNRNESRVSFNGGNGGVEMRATSQQEAVSRQRHVAPIAAQTEHVQAARANPESRASSNHGRPPAAIDNRPQPVNDHLGASPARTVTHPNDLAPIQRPEPVNSGNAKADRKYQQQQDSLIVKQNQERQSLQQKQDAEHQQLSQRKANDSQVQQVEQRHQQQTQQLSDKHASQQQSLQSRQPQPRQQQQQQGRPDKKN